MHKLKETLEGFCELIEGELCDLHAKLSKNNTMTTADAELMDTLLHSLKSDKTVLAMLEYSDSDERGYSGRSYNVTGRYDDGYSVHRYSRDSEKEDMIRKLEMKLDHARTEAEAMAIRDAIKAISRMDS